MKSDMEDLLSVSRVAMGPPKTPAQDVRIEDEFASAPPETAADELPFDVFGVPSGALSWP